MRHLLTLTPLLALFVQACNSPEDPAPGPNPVGPVTGQEALVESDALSRLHVSIVNPSDRPLAGTRVVLGLVVQVAGGRRVAASFVQRTDAAGEVAFDVPAGSTVALFAAHEETSFVEELLELHPSAGDDFCRIVLAAPRASGRLRIAPPEGDQASLAEGDQASLEGLRFSLVSPWNGESVASLEELEPDPEGWLNDIPCGSYRAVAVPREDDPRRHFAFQTESREVLTVSAGGAPRVSLTCALGGRLELELRLPGGVRLAEARALDQLSPSKRRLRRAMLEEEHGAIVRLTAGDTERTLTFSAGAGENHRPAALIPGERSLALDLLPAGEYQLSVAAPGFEPAAAALRVAAGKVIPLVVELVPRTNRR